MKPKYSFEKSKTEYNWSQEPNAKQLFSRFYVA